MKNGDVFHSEAGPVGVLIREEMVDINGLKVDESYQRGVASESNTLRMARNFRHEAAGVLILAERQDGSLYIIDGRQRWEAAKKRGDIRYMSAKIIGVRSVGEEAELFLLYNKQRIPVRSYDKFKASVTKGGSPEVEIAAWLASQGWHVTQDGTSPNGITFVTALVRSWDVSPEICQRALLAQRQICGHRCMHSLIHRGFCWLMLRGVDIEEHAGKLKRMGGQDAMLREINAVGIEMGRSRGERVCGLGILRLINHRKQSNRISIAADA